MEAVVFFSASSAIATRTFRRLLRNAANSDVNSGSGSTIDIFRFLDYVGSPLTIRVAHPLEPAHLRRPWFVLPASGRANPADNEQQDGLGGTGLQEPPRHQRRSRGYARVFRIHRREENPHHARPDSGRVIALHRGERRHSQTQIRNRAIRWSDRAIS